MIVFGIIAWIVSIAILACFFAGAASAWKQEEEGLRGPSDPGRPWQ